MVRALWQNNKLKINFLAKPDFRGFFYMFNKWVWSAFWSNCKFIRIYSRHMTALPVYMYLYF